MYFLAYILSSLFIIFLIGIVVLLHEFGHFIAAKLVGIRVEKFGFGLSSVGPVLFRKKIGETEFIFYLLFFLGGYVTYPDSNPHTDLPMNSKKRFLNKNKWEQAFVVFSGILMNFITAFIVILLIGFFWKFIPVNNYDFHNTPAVSNNLTIDRNSNNSTALKVYLRVYKKGESHKNIRKNSFEEVNKSGVMVSSSDTFITAKYYKINNFIDLIKGSFICFFNQFKVFYFYIVQLLTGKIAISELRGIISIIRIGSDFMVNNQTYNCLWLIAFLSINMGIANLVPIPILDGSKLLFILMGRVINKSVERRKIITISRYLYLSVISFMFLLIINDIFSIYKGII